MSLDSQVLWIRDLIDHESKKWNQNMLDKILLPYDKERINQIHIGNDEDEDTTM